MSDESNASDWRVNTMVAGVALKSTDFGAGDHGAPKTASISGLGLPPATELIRVPTVDSLKSATVIALEASEAKRQLDWRAQVFERKAVRCVGRVVSGVSDCSVDMFTGGYRGLTWLFGVTRRRGGQVGRWIQRRGPVVLSRSLDVAVHVLIVSGETIATASRRAIAESKRTIGQLTGSAFEEFSDGDAQAKQDASLFACVETALRIRADDSASEALHLPRGSRVTVFPDHPAREGWLLAQGEGGEVGFLRRIDLDGGLARTVLRSAPR